MNPYSLFPLFGAFIALLFGMLVFLHDRRDFSNTLFFAVSFTVAYLSFGLFAFRQVDSGDVAWVWIRSQFIWPFLFTFVLHHAMAFAKYTGVLRSRPALMAIYGSALAIGMVHLFTKTMSPGPEDEWWGWSPAIPDGSALLYLIAVWVIGMVATAFGILVYRFFTVTDRRFRAQTKFLIIGYALPLATMVTINVALPFFDIAVPDMSPPVFALGAGFFAYGVIRHQLFTLTPRAVSQEILETMSDAVLLIDTARSVVSVNSAGTRLLGLSADSVVGLPVSRFLPHDFPEPASDESSSRGVNTGVPAGDADPTYGDTSLTTGSGLPVAVSLAVTPLRYSDGTDAGAVLVARDTSERRSMEERVANLEEQRRGQALREAKEDERKHLAEELHDQTLMELASLAVEVGFAERESADSQSVAPQLREIRAKVHSTESGLRDILRGLYPDVLTNLGLPAAIRSFLDGQFRLANETANPVTIRLAVSGFGDERPEELAELTAYRLVQQSTFNAIRHGRPKSIDVALDWTGGEISVEISDDGTGFVLTDAERQRATGRHGIANLYDRVYAVGGQIDIETSPGSGTRVRATIPTGDAIGPGGEPEHTAYEPDLRERGSL